MSEHDGRSERMVARADLAVKVMLAEGPPADPRALIDIPVRPEADAFPMLDAEAFLGLVEGIRANGQIEPIELDRDGAIGDGRNRYAACRRLGVEPSCITLPADTDWLARVVEKNLNRRHATQGARAVALVRVLSSQGRREIGRAGMAGISNPSLIRARFLVDRAPDLAAQVTAGASLRVAYEEAVRAGRERADAERAAVEDDDAALRRLESLEREAAALVSRLHAVRDEDAEAVVIPPEPDLEIRLAAADDVERATVPPLAASVDALRLQERMAAQMGRVKADIEAVRAFDIGPDAPMFEGLVLALRSWGSQVVAATYGIVEHYNVLLDDDGQLRRVK